MKVHLNARQFDLTDAIADHVTAKFARLDGLGASILEVHVVLQRDDNENPETRFHVRSQLAVAGPDIHAEDWSEDLYAAVDGVVDKLARQLRKRKTRLTDKPRSTEQRRAILGEGVVPE